MRIKSKLMTLLLFSLMTPIALAGTLESGLKLCGGITDDGDRLSCFDALSASTADILIAQESQTITDDIGRKREREKKKVKAKNEKYDVKIIDCVKSASSNRLSFKLESGQVWRQKNAKWLSTKACKGKGIIQSGYFGYTLYVEAMDRSVGVIRAD